MWSTEHTPWDLAGELTQGDSGVSVLSSVPVMATVPLSTSWGQALCCDLLFRLSCDSFGEGTLLFILQMKRLHTGQGGTAAWPQKFS
jgi:hypothetical protein